MKKILNKWIDKQFYKIGWNKVEENQYYILYEKYDSKYNYTHKIDISHKKSGNHTISSYFDEETGNLYAYCIGLNFKESLLSTLRLKLTFK
jgi:hypothetical protein|nr:MAG TPA: hypothetical protein [Caudoviricetes sp.]